MSHLAVVVKVPQDCTPEEFVKAASYAYQFRHTLTASHDDMLTVLRGGRPDSYVKLLWPDRQPELPELIVTNGFSWQTVDGFTETKLKLGFPFRYRYSTSSAFNTPRNYGNGQHEGIDYIVPGQGADKTAEVLCVLAGTVDRVAESPSGYGKYVRIASYASGQNVSIWYAHLDKQFVKAGQMVAAGEPVGEIGNTGNSTGEHLHLTMQLHGRGLAGYVVADVVDPAPFLPSMAQAAMLPPYLPLGQTIDLLPYLMGDGRLYEVRHPDGATERLQTQRGAAGIFYQTKNHLWEELRADEFYIWRGLDTSPAPDSQGRARVYRQYEPGQSMARWCPRRMAVGQTWTAPVAHTVQFYEKGSCHPLSENSGQATNRMTLVAHHRMRVWNGLTINDVIEMKSPHETYFFARGYGLVAWGSSWGSSAIVEEHAAGQRPNNEREDIRC